MTTNLAPFPPLTIEEVGQRFVSYYRELGYQELPSSSLLTDSLPMTFVMSAGMVQFELLADKERKSDKFALIQRCFRHFDIEQVGDSNYHLSLFHMPGAFVFGAIDRQKVVSDLWHLLVDVYRFSPESLAITYFQGERIDGSFVPRDGETAQAWQDAGMPPERIFALPAEQNFWKQSERMVGIVNSRKCGPNTEVFYDRGATYACGPDCRPGCPCGRYVEFSNTLFIERQFSDDNTLIPLEEPFTETVIGQERVAMLLQKATSVYEIETVLPLVQQVQCFSEPGELADEDVTHYERIIADHLRALLYLTYDGAPRPDRGGRARLMRILVREFLTACEILGITDPAFLRAMFYISNDLYPETKSVWQKVQQYIDWENIRFQETLQKGMSSLDKRIQKKGRITGAELFDYKNKQGIPFALLQYRLRQKGIPLSKNEYITYQRIKDKFSIANKETGKAT